MNIYTHVCVCMCVGRVLIEMPETHELCKNLLRVMLEDAVSNCEIVAVNSQIRPCRCAFRFEALGICLIFTALSRTEMCSIKHIHNKCTCQTKSLPSYPQPPCPGKKIIFHYIWYKQSKCFVPTSPCRQSGRVR